MMRFATPAMLAAMFVASTAIAQSNSRSPHIGYAYPAGAQRGQTVTVIVGGQFINGAKEALVSGEGIEAKVLKVYRPARNINGDQRKEIQRLLLEHSEDRWAELAAEGKVGQQPPWRRGARKPAPTPKETKDGEKAEPVKLPEHPLLNNLDNKSLRELAAIRELLFNRRKSQPNAQIGELAEVEVTVSDDAQPGDRELRLGGRQGLTNPIVFQVGQLPEGYESEGNDPGIADPLPAPAPLALPVTVNGQIMPGDVDRITFRAKAGQKLVVDVDARRLVPFLADAVPGWFQATVAIFDAKGNELAFDDDFRFDPDPVLYLKIPADGVYELEIRDSIYRGREDFVYRISIGEFPFITSAFPLGAPAGGKATMKIDGWNLPTHELAMDTAPGASSIRHTALPSDVRMSNAVTYAVDTLPEIIERETNGDVKHAEAVELPLIVNGRIDEPGDVDVYKFKAAKGDTIVAEVVARRLHSPMDSLVRLIDKSGKVIAWNDDHMDMQGYLHRGMGTQTHHADSYLSAELPADGWYYVQISDAAEQGGPAYAYRMRISHPQPDFELRVSPSNLSIPVGRSMPVTVHALRKDGFDGPITLAMTDSDLKFVIDGAIIPAGRDFVRTTITAPTTRPDGMLPLGVQGQAEVGDETITRQAVPCDDVMQAFLWRHLVPSEQMLVSVTGGRRSGPVPQVIGDLPVKLTRGKATTITLKAPTLNSIAKPEMEAFDAPEGITLINAEYDKPKRELRFDVTVDDNAVKPGLADNLIIAVSGETSWKQKDGTLRTRRRDFGTLPAIPFVVVEE